MYPTKLEIKEFYILFPDKLLEKGLNLPSTFVVDFYKIERERRVLFSILKKSREKVCWDLTELCRDY